MSISEFEFYHGVVFSQIVRNPGVSLKLIERTGEHGWGEYQISDNHHTYRLFIKTSSICTKGRKGRRYSNFSFSVSDVDRLRAISGNVLLCLVCADQEICTLEWEDVTKLAITRNREACNVNVSWSKGTELHVKSKFEELPYTISRNKLKSFSWT